VLLNWQWWLLYIWCCFDNVLNVFDYQCFQILSECNKAEQWLREKSQQQDAMPRNTDPVLWSSDIKSRKEDLDMYYSSSCFICMPKISTLYCYTCVGQKTQNIWNQLYISYWNLNFQVGTRSISVKIGKLKDVNRKGSNHSFGSIVYWTYYTENLTYFVFRSINILITVTL
jgi:hypothetical protein